MDDDKDEDEVQTVQSNWLNAKGRHEKISGHAGLFTPQGLVAELNRKKSAVFLQYFDAKIVKEIVSHSHRSMMSNARRS